MIDQALFQIILGVAAAAVGLIAARILVGIRDLEQRIVHLNTKITDLEVMVARTAVTHGQFTGVTSALFGRIEKLDDKLDHKADK